MLKTKHNHINTLKVTYLLKILRMRDKMKFISIILGVLVIVSWLFVLRDYKKGNQNSESAKTVVLIACVLTFIMTVLQILD